MELLGLRVGLKVSHTSTHAGPDISGRNFFVVVGGIRRSHGTHEHSGTAAAPSPGLDKSFGRLSKRGLEACRRHAFKRGKPLAVVLAAQHFIKLPNPSLVTKPVPRSPSCTKSRQQRGDLGMTSHESHMAGRQHVAHLRQDLVQSLCVYRWVGRLLQLGQRG